MKKITTVFLAAFLLLSVLAGPIQAGAASGDYIFIPEGTYTDSGEYIPPGYYYMDGTYIPLEGAQSPSEPDEPVTPSDPVSPEDPSEPDDPDEPVTPEDPDDPTPSTQPDQPITGDQPQLDPELSRQVVRIGLRYGSTAMDGANLGNTVGSGFFFGYYDSENRFVQVGYTTKTTISVVKTENVYYGTYNGYASYYDHLSGSGVGVGCYHLQLSGSYRSFEEANAVASQYSGGFAAYIGGTYYARIGNYLTRDAAVAAQSELAASGISTELKGTSSYALNVVVKGTNTIIFQYDDNGNGTGLGVEPIPTTDGQKCVSVFAGTDYYGGFRYERISGGDLTIVNMIAVDDYIKGVICEEMSPNWHIEALKAQAVAARSYVLHNTGNHRKYHFDACTTTHCQVYGGLTHAEESTDLAVDSTMGVVGRYNGKIINSVFYSSNGGASESSSVVWGSNQSSYPYLVGVVDPYEATVNISGYEWTRTYTGSELAAMLQDAGYKKCSKIVAVEITEYTPSGNPAWIEFTDDQGKIWLLNASAVNNALPLRSYRYEFLNTQEFSLTINGEESVDALDGLYALDENGNLVPVQEHAYIITDSGVVSADGTGAVTGDTFTIVGRGWGHNVGMSQYGAQAMAKLGYTYDQILKFYYTGITVG